MSGGWPALAGALFATAQAQLSYKLYFRARRRVHLAVAIACFVGASVCAYLALKSLSIGMVYMSTALTQLMVVGLAHRVLGEPFTRDHGIAMVLIVVGILVYAT
ncbi:MAG: EamA family transporter [Nitrospirae bacterium]|nr:EamA family transporter [Nitrospirota bacterium]